jgi:hypothetical protein
METYKSLAPCNVITLLLIMSANKMPPVRPRARFTRWLALAALALQMVVSFGHVHLDGIHSAYPAAGVAAFKAQAQPLPAQQSGDDDDGYCAICASIYLAANSFVPQPPPLPAPFVSRPIEHFDRADIGFVAPRRTPFQSRAPPLG